MKGKKLIWILGSVFVVLIIVSVLIAQKYKNDDVIKVVVTKAEKASITESVTANGKIYPKTEVKISSEVSGEIVRVLVKEGDSVSRGQLLLEINPVNYESSLSRADAALNQMKASEAQAQAQIALIDAQFEQAELAYKRSEKLYKDKVISAAEFESASSAYKSAKANKSSALQSLLAAQYSVKSGEATLIEARQNLNKTRIFAPQSGIISQLNVKQGEMVVGAQMMAGTELLRIADLNNMEARVDVNENQVLKVKVGDSVEVEVDAYDDRKFKGIVTDVGYSTGGGDLMSQATSEQVANFEVKIRILPESYSDLTNQNSSSGRFPFRPGMTAVASIQTKKLDDILTVPIASVTTRKPDEKKKEKGGFQFSFGKDEEAEENKTTSGKKPIDVVFVLEGEVVKMVAVKTGIQNDERIQIMDGLNPGQEVISAPFKAIDKDLMEGSKVKSVTEDELFEVK